MWPGITLHFVRALATPRWEDYDIEHKRRENGGPANRFLYLGKGFVLETLDASADDSLHLSLHQIDKRWINALRLGVEKREFNGNVAALQSL